MTGLLLDELTTNYPRDLVVTVVRDELEQGRVICDEVGRFRLVESAFDPGVVTVATDDDPEPRPLRSGTETQVVVIDRRLADDLVDDELFGLSCDELARRLHQRRSALVAVMRDDPRFVREGRTHGSRWRVVAGRGPGPNGTGSGRNETPWVDLDTSGIPVVEGTDLDAS